MGRRCVWMRITYENRRSNVLLLYVIMFSVVLHGSLGREQNYGDLYGYTIKTYFICLEEINYLNISYSIKSNMSTKSLQKHKLLAHC